MLYKKIDFELMVVADEAEAVIAELNNALDELEERHTLFGGAIETVAFEHTGRSKRSALAARPLIRSKAAFWLRATVLLRSRPYFDVRKRR